MQNYLLLVKQLRASTEVGGTHLSVGIHSLSPSAWAVGPIYCDVAPLTADPVPASTRSAHGDGITIASRGT